MEELLQKLVENDLLNEETKQEIKEAFDQRVQEAVEEERTNVRAELAEQFVADKEALIEALDTKAEEYLKSEIEELREDIDRYRDLEAEYAEKVVEAREEMKETLQSDMKELVEMVDTFLDMALDEEFQELREDIEEVKRIQFGKEMYEAFESVFTRRFADENGVANELEEKEQRLEDTQRELNEAQQELDSIKRSRKLDEVLSDLQGRPKEVMEQILQSVPTNRLEEAYNRFIGKVLHESAGSSEVSESEKESDEEEQAQVLAESKAEEEAPEGTVVAKGDLEEVEESTLEESHIPEDVRREIERGKRLGIGS